MHDEVEPPSSAAARSTSPLAPAADREVAVPSAGRENAEPVSVEPRGDRAPNAPGPAGDECSSGVGHPRNHKSF